MSQPVQRSSEESRVTPVKGVRTRIHKRGELASWGGDESPPPGRAYLQVLVLSCCNEAPQRDRTALNKRTLPGGTQEPPITWLNPPFLSLLSTEVTGFQARPKSRVMSGQDP